MFREIDGDLIELALGGQFDVIAHGCNCFCIMGAGIAKAMDNKFFCNSSSIYPSEDKCFEGDYNKLGTIEGVDWIIVNREDKVAKFLNKMLIIENFKEGGSYYNLGYRNPKVLSVVNCYTQDEPGKNADYDAINMCLKKLNNNYKGKRIGIPAIGCGIGGGDIGILRRMIATEMHDCEATLVIYNK